MKRALNIERESTLIFKMGHTLNGINEGLKNQSIRRRTNFVFQRFRETFQFKSFVPVYVLYTLICCTYVLLGHDDIYQTDYVVSSMVASMCDIKQFCTFRHINSSSIIKPPRCYSDYLWSALAQN